MNRYFNIIVLILAVSFILPVVAEDLGGAVTLDKKEKTWWEKRKDMQPDLYYPHKIHMDTMKKKGDSCMLCHTFMKNEMVESTLLKKITRIANEPGKAICHECHVLNISAPSRCNLCHQNIDTITPESHHYNYKYNHAEDSRVDESECRRCHIDISFCSDCHFRRDTGQRKVHTVAYLNSHGLDARFDSASCGRCHNASYCSDCHRSLP
ncbi:hypothetical protein MNBD_GAMMA25-106 [hydrothermal vent metagenome]|uniref:Uncharacterized protein n=1 Tax=hydrothermal vent metagenome TaxID=652676 RepID=A0A3B1ASQ8_9ZZZZ